MKDILKESTLFKSIVRGIFRYILELSLVLVAVWLLSVFTWLVVVAIVEQVAGTP